MDEAPKEIWAWPKGSWFTAGASDRPVKVAGALDVKYLRADLAAAQVAAAYERAADHCQTQADLAQQRYDASGMGFDRGASVTAEELAADFRDDFATSDQTDALEAVRREAIKVKLHEAANKAEAKCKLRGQYELGQAVRDTILALIDKGPEK